MAARVLERVNPPASGANHRLSLFKAIRLQLVQSHKLVLFNQTLRKEGTKINNRIIFTVLILFLTLTIGSVTTMASEKDDRYDVVVKAKPKKASVPTAVTTAEPRVLKPEEIVPEIPGLELLGQSITGHKVVKLFGSMEKVIFSTNRPVPGGDSWAFVCDKLAAGEIPSHVSFFFHGDNEVRWVEKDRNQIIKRAKKIRTDTCWVIPYRPYSRGDNHWKSEDEIRYHLAMVDYFIEVFKLKTFDVYGQSGGGLVATAMLQERRQNVRFAGLASPILAVKKRWPYSASWLYDPYNHIERLLFRTPKTQEVCMLVVWDPRDKSNVNSKAVLPYFEKAKELGLGGDKVRLVKVRSSDRRRHITHSNLGRQVRKLKKKGSFCL